MTHIRFTPQPEHRIVFRSVVNCWLRYLVIITIPMIIWPMMVRAQNIETYFPSGIWGYDQELGVTVLSRLRPLYEPPGIPAGAFIIRPTLAQSVLYNSSLFGTPDTASWGSRTNAGVSASSNWSRNSLGGLIDVDHFQYFSLPSASYTNWNLGIGGGYTIGDSMLSLYYYHSTYNFLGTTLASVRTEAPIAIHTDTAISSYTFNLGRLSITPDISGTAYRFGEATVQGSTIDQAFLNNNVLAGGVTTRYTMSEEGSLVLVARSINAYYISPQPGQPSNNSNSVLVLGGIDYQSKGVWRYRLLVGVERRAFPDSNAPTHTAASVQGSVIWQPTGLTTVTGLVSRMIENPQTSNTNGYVLSQARLVLDHELRRNALLQLRAGIENAAYLQAGSQSAIFFGGGITWLINRNLRLSFDYNFTKQNAGSGSTTTTTTTSNPAALTTGAFSQNVAALTLQIAF